MPNVGTHARVGIAALLFFCACSSSPPKEPAAVPVVVLPVAKPAPAPSEPIDLTAPCTNGPMGLRCDGILGEEERASLPGAIEAAKKRRMETNFGDVRAMVKLALLELRRDEDVADAEGKSDAARGLRDAMRAVAVDEFSDEARLALALGIARSLQEMRASTDPAVRGLAFSLVLLVLNEVSSHAPKRVSAAVRTLGGYVELEQGTPRSGLFQIGLSFDQTLGTTWMGIGDAARSASDFDGAAKAYRRAATLLPADAGVVRSIAAATRGEPLAVPAAWKMKLPPFEPGPLAAGHAAVPKCSLAQAATGKGAVLCSGLARLQAPSNRDDLEQAAATVFQGWKEMSPLCEARDPACGPIVAEALAAASRAFHDAGRIAKSITIARIALDPRYHLARLVEPALTLEIGDQYYSIGVFSEAAGWYARHARLSGATAVPAAQRALALYTALGNAEEATRLADDLAHDTHLTEAQRAGWIVSAAAAVRAVHDPGAAASWLERHRALIDRAGLAAAAAEVTAPLPPAEPPSKTCPAPLTCAVRRLAGEAL